MGVKLLERVRQTIRLRHYSVRTDDACVHWIRRFIVFHDMRYPRGWCQIASLAALSGDRQIGPFRNDRQIPAIEAGSPGR